jgi:hypothetical protein
MKTQCLFLLGAIFACVHTCAAVSFEPYSFSWVRGAPSSQYSVRSLKDVPYQRAHFGFVTGDGKNDLHEDVINSIPDMKAFVARGGHLSLSFGGAAGCYLETIQSVDKMASTIQWLVGQTGAQAIDFDVEGKVVSNWGANEVRVKAIVKVQKAMPQLRTSMTVAAGPGGMPTDVFNMVRYHRDLGMRIDVINLMLMDYGSLDGRSFADVSIGTMEDSARQIRELYPQSNAFSRMAGTLMIGFNDDGTVCEIADAAKVRAFADEKKMVFVSLWAIQRDQSKRGNYNDCSLAQTFDFAFSKVLSRQN